MRPGPDEVRDVDWALQIVSRLERDDRYQAWEAAHVLADAVKRVVELLDDEDRHQIQMGGSWVKWSDIADALDGTP